MSYPPDWHPDPAGDPSLLRWWDGIQWTEHTQPMPQQHQPQQPEVAAQPAAQVAAEPIAEVAPFVQQLDEDRTVARPAQTASAPAAPQPAEQPAAASMGASPDAVAGIRSDLLSGDYAEVDANARVMLQNSRMLKVNLGEPVLARQGSMVAFQGQVDFDHEGSGGVSKFLKKAATGEGVQLMRCSGQGEVFLASEADQVHILQGCCL